MYCCCLCTKEKRRKQTTNRKHRAEEAAAEVTSSSRKGSWDVLLRILWKTRTQIYGPLCHSPGASEPAMGGGPSQVRGPTTSTQNPFQGGQAKQEVMCVFFVSCNLVINSRGQGEEGTGEAKGLRLPLESGPWGQACAETPLGCKPWTAILLNNPVPFPWE